MCMTVDNFNVDRIIGILAQHGVTKADAMERRPDESPRAHAGTGNGRREGRDARALYRRSRRPFRPAAGHDILRRRRRARQRVPRQPGAGAEEGAARGQGYQPFHQQRVGCEPFQSVLSGALWTARAIEAGRVARARRRPGRQVPDVHRRRRRPRRSRCGPAPGQHQPRLHEHGELQRRRHPEDDGRLRHQPERRRRPVRPAR